jgi:hypothetical protein
MNNELGATCLESGIENAPQNIKGTVHGIELLAFEKREHGVEIHHAESYCYRDLSVLQGLLRFGRALFTGAKPHMIMQIQQIESELVKSYRGILKMTSDEFG